MYKNKEDILKDFQELELTDFGDFRIKQSFVKDYEIIDFHCHLYEGLKSFIPKLFRKSNIDFDASFFDLSCFPSAIKYFDFNKEMFTTYPEKLISLDGLKLAYEITGLGGFVFTLQKSTPQRMIRDMKLNNVSKAVVLQINTPTSDSSASMKRICSTYDEFISFGSIHPYETNIITKIEKSISDGAKGWKINPHISGIAIDDDRTIDLLRHLADTQLPIISCSGLAFPNSELHKSPKKLRLKLETQNLKRFHNVLLKVPNIKFVFAHGGAYQTKEVIELMKIHPNTFVEISTQPPQNIAKLINKVGSERIVYGTDYPAFNHAFSIVSVLRATKHNKEREDIFSNTAKQLLNC